MEAILRGTEPTEQYVTRADVNRGAGVVYWLIVVNDWSVAICSTRHA